MNDTHGHSYKMHRQGKTPFQSFRQVVGQSCAVQRRWSHRISHLFFFSLSLSLSPSLTFLITASKGSSFEGKGGELRPSMLLAAPPEFDINVKK